MSALGRTLSSFVAVAVAMLGGWLLVINLVERRDYEGRIYAWILFSGAVGLVGGTVYLLSIVGPQRFRSSSWRLWGWAAMLASALLPHSLQFFILAAVLALIPTFFISERAQDTVTSS